MTNIRRYYKDGNIYFLTHVTCNRDPILIDNFDLFDESIRSLKMKNKFDIFAWVVLPDHFHMIINPFKEDLSVLMKKLKLKVSARYRIRNKSTSGRIWQYRFWDHIIRDQNDLNKHIDYIHYNPVKHNLVMSPFEWKYSSVHEYRNEGYYNDDWGVKDRLTFKGEFVE